MSKSLLSSFNKNHDLTYLLFVIAALSVAIAFAGGIWDITYHSLNRVDTFFQPAHVLIYLSIAASLALGIILSLKTGFKPLIILSCTMLALGYGDLLWHNAFGFDSALSPTHIALSLTAILNSWFLFQKLREINSRIGLALSLGSLWLSTMLLLIIFSVAPAKTSEIKYYVIPPTAVSFVVGSVAMPILSTVIATKLANLARIRSVYVTTVFASTIAFFGIIANPHVTFVLPLFLAGTLVPSIVFDKNQKVGVVLFGALWFLTYAPYSFSIMAYAINGGIFSVNDTNLLLYSLGPYYPVFMSIGAISSIGSYHLLAMLTTKRRKADLVV